MSESGAGLSAVTVAPARAATPATTTANSAITNAAAAALHRTGAGIRTPTSDRLVNSAFMTGPSEKRCVGWLELVIEGWATP